MPELHRVSNIVAHSSSASLTAVQVATAYGLPGGYDGSGQTVGIIELGGAYIAGDMARAGLQSGNVQVVSIDSANPKSDGPDGADGEVMLDVEIVAAVATGAAIRVFFAPNTDAGFLDAIRQAVASCDIVSISWGGPESSWDAATMDAYAAVLSAARTRGVTVFVAAGDAGSRDGTSKNAVDFPASSPSVIGCGGTQLRLNADGTRASEVTWDDSNTKSATGGGVSAHFPGRQVPDIAGNASPTTGYRVVVDGGNYVVGGTSAVAPLMAACLAVVQQAATMRYRTDSSAFDLLNLILTNPTVAYDVTVGDNGGFKAGPGRDEVTGFGVIDWGRVLTVLTSGTQLPAPGGNPTPVSTPEPAPVPGPNAPPFAEYETFRTALETARPHPASKPKVAALIRDATAYEVAYDAYLGRTA